MADFKEKILYYQEKLNKDPSPHKLLQILERLDRIPITLELLQETGVGKTVNNFRKNEAVGDKVRDLVQKWKQQVDLEKKLAESPKTVEKNETEDGRNVKYSELSNKRDRHKSQNYNVDKIEKSEKYRSVNNNFKSEMKDKYKNNYEKVRKFKTERYESDNDSDNRADSDAENGNESSEDTPSISSSRQCTLTVETIYNERYDEDGRPMSEPYELIKKDMLEDKLRKESKQHRSKSKENKHKQENEIENHKKDKLKSSPKVGEFDGGFTQNVMSFEDCLIMGDNKKKRKKLKLKEAEKSEEKHRSKSDNHSSSKPHKFKEEEKSKSHKSKTDESSKSHKSREDEKSKSHKSHKHGDSKSHSDKSKDSKSHSDKSKDSKSHPEKSKDSKSHSEKSKDSKSHSDKSKDSKLHSDKTKNSKSHSEKSKNSKSHSDKSKVKKLKDEKLFDKYNEYAKDERSSSEEGKRKADNVACDLLKKKPKFTDIDILSTLPEIQPDYKPLPHRDLDYYSNKKKVIVEDPSKFTTSRSSRTQVFSGRKTTHLTEVPSLYDVCIKVLIENIDSIECVGIVTFDMLKPVLDRCTPQQLYNIEDYNPHFIEDTDNIWQVHCGKEFRGCEPDEFESWRELYLRKRDEREARFKSITANISASLAKANPVRATKLAYVDGVVKPPREVRRKQARHGTGDFSHNAPKPKPNIPKSASSHSSSSSSRTFEDRTPVAPPPAANTSIGSSLSGFSNSSAGPDKSFSSNRAQKTIKVVAPMMQKVRKMMKNQFRR